MRKLSTKQTSYKLSLIHAQLSLETALVNVSQNDEIGKDSIQCMIDEVARLYKKTMKYSEEGEEDDD